MSKSAAYRHLHIPGSAILLSYLIFLLTGTSAYATVRYVKAGAAGAAPYTSWATASGNLQTIITACSVGDTIWVARGTYMPSGGSSFTMKEGVCILGGFSGLENDLRQRSVTLYKDTLKGNGANVVRNQFTSGTALSKAAVLDGFVITGGTSTSGGGGMYNYYASPTVRNCTFYMNSTSGSGAGMFIYNASPVLINCVFYGNSVTASNAYGGGIYINGSSAAQITNCSFINNKALGATRGSGAGIYNTSTQPCQITDCLFSGNSASGTSTSGGGIYSLGGGSFTCVIARCTFSGNTAIAGTSGAYGGGVYISQANQFNNCVFVANTSFSSASIACGGGLYADAGVGASMTNCTFSGNTSTSADSVGYGGAIGELSRSGLNITNSIIWANTASSAGSNIYYPSSTILNVRYSDVQDYSGGVANISTDPLFANAVSGDLRLQASSPCVNTGWNSAVAGATDAAGNTRIIKDTVDKGAYEYLPAVIHVDSTYGNDTNGGGSWSAALKSLSAALSVLGKSGTILIAKGTYYPHRINRDSAFTILRGGVKVYGGYAPGGGMRDLAVYRTILSGDIGTAGTTTDNSRHVIMIAGLDETADSVIFDGFTVSDGRADTIDTKVYASATTYKNEGPAIYLHSNNGAGGKITVRNCIFTNNTAANYGSGFYNQLSSPTVINCTISNNICTGTGTGSGGGGGGMFCYNFSSPTVINCNITGNAVSTASQTGGGLLAFNFASPKLINCNITNNTANSGGGISLNYAYAGGPQSPVVLINCAICNNKATNTCGGLYIPTLLPVNITNSIIWGNTAAVKPGAGVGAAIRSSDVQDGYIGTGNINSDPLFEASAAGDFRLKAGSPCINTGNNDSLATDIQVDYAGNGRVKHLWVDMGAYESDYTGCPAFVAAASNIIYVDSSGSSGGNGNSWARPFKTLSDALDAARQCGSIDSILIAKGTYYPTGMQNGADRDSAFTILRGKLKVYGGYPAKGGTRNIGANPTVLSGNIGADSGATDNSYHVAVIVGVTAAGDSVVLDGLTIKDGYSTDDAGTSYKTYNGISTYRTVGAGLASLNNAGNVMIRNCIFFGNTAKTQGGGIYNDASSATFRNCIFRANTAAEGGGIAHTGYSPVMSNCIFYENTATAHGGGMMTYSSAAAMGNCSFFGNSATYGGGIYNQSAAISLPRISNTILWGNTAAHGAGIFNVSGLAVISNSDVQDTVAGTGNVYANPLFANAAAAAGADGLWGTADDGLRLLPCSPAINTGDNDSVIAGTTMDIKSGTRIQLGRVDMGAYEAASNVADTSAALAMVTTSVMRTQSGRQLYTNDCSSLIASVISNGASPASGSINAKVYIDTTSPGYSGQPYVYRHYDIIPTSSTVASSGTATVTLYFTQPDFDNYNSRRGGYAALPTSPSDVVGILHFSITQLHGTSATGTPDSYSGWTGTGPAKVLVSASLVWNDLFSRWEATFPVTGFSGFFATGSTGVPLPIMLKNITATNAGQVNYVRWETLHEEPGDIFNLERSADGGNFEPLARINATNPLTGGEYSYSDASPYTGMNFYRLKINKGSGDILYSKTVRADVKDLFSIVAFPNPVIDELMLDITGAALLGGIIQLFDASGKQIREQVIPAGTGNMKLDFSMSALATGSYVIRFIDGLHSQIIQVQKQ